MSKLAAFFGRNGAQDAPSATVSSAAVPNATADGMPAIPPAASDSPIDEAALASMGSRIGAENEGVRGLLVEAARKVEELDLLKTAFGNIVAPVNGMLRDLEQEKSQNAGLRNLLNDVRANLDELRNAHATSERERAALSRDNASLQQDLAAHQNELRGLEASQTELTSQIAAFRAQIGQLERQLSAESGQRQTIEDAHRLVSEQIQVSDRKNVGLEAELRGLTEKLLLAGEEKQSLQKSLEQSIADAARMTRRLSENEGALAAARSRIGELEAAIGEGESARNALQARLEEGSEQHHSEVTALSNRLDSLQSRLGASDKLLTDLREALAARTEEAREWECRAADAEGARGVSDRKLALIESANTALEQQIGELTQSRATLVERSGAAGKTLKLRETALARAEDKIAALSERVKQLESDNRALRERDEKRIEDLNGALNRERMARAVAEGALASSRRDFARVQEEIASVNMQGIVRSGTDAQTPAALARRVKSNLSKAVAAAGEPMPKARNGRKGSDDKSADDQATKN